MHQALQVRSWSCLEGLDYPYGTWKENPPALQKETEGLLLVGGGGGGVEMDFSRVCLQLCKTPGVRWRNR